MCEEGRQCVHFNQFSSVNSHQHLFSIILLLAQHAPAATRRDVMSNLGQPHLAAIHFMLIIHYSARHHYTCQKKSVAE
jgi:hypothetical protein